MRSIRVSERACRAGCCRPDEATLDLETPDLATPDLARPDLVCFAQLTFDTIRRLCGRNLV